MVLAGLIIVAIRAYEGEKENHYGVSKRVLLESCAYATALSTAGGALWITNRPCMIELVSRVLGNGWSCSLSRANVEVLE